MPTMDYSRYSPFSYKEGLFLNYNEIFNVYNLKPKHLRKTKAALAKVKTGTGFFKYATLGDSTVAGTTLASPGPQSWSGALKTLLSNAGYPSAGTGVVAAYNGGISDPRLNAPAPWVAFNSNSSILQNNTNAANNALVFTSDVAGTIARVYYTSGGQPFTVSIDGGAAVTVTPAGGATTPYYEVTGLANTTHTISVLKANIVNTCYIHGFEVRSNASTGVLLYNAGVSGIKAVSITNVNYSALRFAIQEFASDLIMIRCQTNDTGNTSDSVYKTDMANAISGARSTGADVVLMTAVPSSGKDFTSTTQILYDLADQYDIPLIDHQKRWGTYTESNANGLMNDTFHPNVAGHSDEALSIFRALGF